MDKEIRTLYFQDEKPTGNLKQGDVWFKRLNEGFNKGLILIYHIPNWAQTSIDFVISSDRCACPVTLKTALDMLLSDYPYCYFNFRQHPGNQIIMIGIHVNTNHD